MQGRKASPKKREQFLTKLRDTCNVTIACRTIKISRQTAYRWKGEDKAFAEEWDNAVEEAVDALEAEVHRRAFSGTDEPVFYQGAQCGQVRKYSDTLAIFLLKSHRPEKYRERFAVDHSGEVKLSSIFDDIDGKTRGVPNGKRSPAARD